MTTTTTYDLYCDYCCCDYDYDHYDYDYDYDYYNYYDCNYYTG